MSPPKMKAESRYRNCLNRAATSGITSPFSVITAGGSASLMLHGAICSMSASAASRPQPATLSASTAMTAAFRMALPLPPLRRWRCQHSHDPHDKHRYAHDLAIAVPGGVDHEANHNSDDERCRYDAERVRVHRLTSVHQGQ